MPFLVRLRPNSQYLLFLVIGLLLIGYGLTGTGAIRVGLVAAGALLAILLGYPIVLSTVFRVPLIAVDDAGIRLPLMGVAVTVGRARHRQSRRTGEFCGVVVGAH